MSLLSRILNLLFVPTCLSCGNRLDSGALCAVCRRAFAEREETICAVCIKPYRRCTCVEGAMKTAGARRHVKLFPYVPKDHESVENRLIYALKSKDYATLHDFFAEKLAEAVLPNIGHNGYAVTYMPRSRASVTRFGFDQSKRIAKALARKLDLPFFFVIRHRGRKTQKQLNRAERKENAEASYYLRRGANISYKRVLLVDDVSTSGATLASGIRLLKSCGVKTVIPVTLGATIYREK